MILRSQKPVCLPLATYEDVWLIGVFWRWPRHVFRGALDFVFHGRSPDWLKMKNPDAPAVKRKAGEGGPRTVPNSRAAKPLFL
jgi:hypothetical protein